MEQIVSYYASFPQWWRSLSLSQRILPAILVLSYWLALLAIGGFRGDHAVMGAVILSLSYSGPIGRKILTFGLPALLTGIVYDSQRFWAHFLRGRIRVEEPYHFDKTFFGIPTDQGVLTPNEWFQLHTHWTLDLITGFFYLTFIAIFVGISAYFYFWLPRKGTLKRSSKWLALHSPKVMWSFFWVNVIGYSTYYWYPAAPPWYVALHGLGPAKLDTPANAAGCLRFDELLGTHFFTEMYGRAADVFGAIPSLHVAYPLLAAIYALKFGALQRFSIFFYLIMCFSAVYLNHHYLLDILWGSSYAVLVYFLLERYWHSKVQLQH